LLLLSGATVLALLFFAWAAWLRHQVLRKTRQIEERSHREARLQAQYRLLVENANDIIYTHTLEGELLSVNWAGEQILGYTAQELIGKNIAELVCPECLQQAKEMISRKVTQAKQTVYEIEVLAKDKKRLILEVSSRLSSTETGNPCVQGVARDITQRKHLEEQLRQAQKMEAVGQLAGGVAHDFNNLLTIIIGYTDLLQSRNISAQQAPELLAEIRRSSERAASLTRQLLAFSRRQILQPIVLNLNGVLGDTEKLLRPLIGEAIELRLDLDPSLLCVKVDPVQIDQMILNLAANSRDAMPHGGKLTIRTANQVVREDQSERFPGIRSGWYAVLEVTDTGSGMDEQTRSHIFEPFFTTKGIGKGTGLGLAMVYGLVQQSGGYITVDSQLGQGTTFRIYLPLAEQPPSAQAEDAAEEEAPGGGETVLVVEDEESVRRLALLTLTAQGYPVLEAANGQEALEKSAQGDSKIDLLVTDVVMPQLGGRELAARLRESRPDIKILYVSGYTNVGALLDGAGEGGSFFLAKPYSPLALARKVREILDGDTDDSNLAAGAAVAS
jgi:PAS domain S-box-containing protein